MLIYFLQLGDTPHQILQHQKNPIFTSNKRRSQRRSLDLPLPSAGRTHAYFLSFFLSSLYHSSSFPPSCWKSLKLSASNLLFSRSPSLFTLHSPTTYRIGLIHTRPAGPRQSIHCQYNTIHSLQLLCIDWMTHSHPRVTFFSRSAARYIPTFCPYHHQHEPFKQTTVFGEERHPA